LKTGVVLNLTAEGYVRRRDFIKVVAGSMAVWSLAARAQQRPKLPTIGFLGANNATFARSSVDAFVQRLRELGWIENQTVAIEYRWAEGHEERFAEIAAEFVRLKVDVIFTYATPSSIAAKKATAVIPIVFAGAGDPIGTGLVASLARPGGNITGLSIQQTDLASKRLEMLRQVLPAVRTVAILGDIGSPNSVLEMGEAEAAAGTLGLAVVTSKLRGAEDIAAAFEALKGRVDALYLCSSPALTTNRIQINSLALGQRLPTMYGFREFTVSGGLMSYGPNFPSLFRRAAEYVDKILRGAKPGDLPVEQPTKFEFIINLTTAKALGLTIPASLMSLADELIE
jgi:putative ABC transport system substrate-binding protein